MATHTVLLVLSVLWSSSGSAHSNKVIELSDKFLDIYNSTAKSWLVQFYGQSCHLSKKLEAEYMQVAQALHDEELNVIVSRIDFHKHRSVARHFEVHSYPTICYIDRAKVVLYENNKYKGDIVDFVRRMVGDQIRTIDSCEQINRLTDHHESSFVYFNETASFEFNDLAEHHIANTWFYLCTVHCFGFEKNGIYSIKRSLTRTPYITKYTKYDSGMGITLKKWVDFMHHPKFINITSDNFDKLLDTNKMLVIVLVKKYVSIARFAHPDHKKYLEMFERVAHLFLDDYFLFGWTSEFEMVRNIAINDLERLPTFVVLDASSYEYQHRPELTNSSQADVVRYLEQIKMGRSNERNGGNTLTHKAQRKLFIIKNKFSKMYSNNPLMTFLLCALPSTIGLLLCCGCIRTYCHSDEEEEQQYLMNKQRHQKIE